MPIYEYVCDHCGKELERLQKMSDFPLRDCPACANPGLRKKVSAAGFQLKGTGWYVTDFKSKPTASETMASGPEGSKDSMASSKQDTPKDMDSE